MSFKGFYKNIALWLFAIAVIIPAAAQNKQITIATKNNMLVLGVDGQQKLLQLHYGQPLPIKDLESLPGKNYGEFYPGFGVNVSTAAVGIKHADGNITTNLVYQKHTSETAQGITTTKIYLKDSHYPLEVVLCFKAYTNEDVIEQWSEITHTEKTDITLFEMASAGIVLQENNYELTYFAGSWNNECNMYRMPLQQGTFTLDAKEGVRTAQKTLPACLLALNGTLQEDSGNVIGATLAWPGNWKMDFMVNENKTLSLRAGINAFASNYILAKNKTFKTPSLLYTYSTNGSGDVTRRFHTWARQFGIEKGNGPRSVLLNNWEATGMDFNEQKLSELIKDGGKMGFDLFLLDDGWFGNKYPRDKDNAGLGDWQTNTKKLPHGLGYLIEECRKNNIKFGLWVEPEMVNPASELYEKHKDWVLSAPHRDNELQRNQMMLDLANPEVQKFILDMLTNLMNENKGISYLKWDCNRYIANAWSTYLGKDRQQNLYVDYTNGLLDIMDKFRQRFPDVTLMACASGGGRIDYGSMKYFDEYWPSDNTGALERIYIQWGMNYFFPTVGFSAHVSDMSPRVPLKFRFDVAMAGKLGMDMQPGHFNEADTAFAKNAIATYKDIEDIVLHGDLYRLVSPYEAKRAALMYTNTDKSQAVVFNYQLYKKNGGDNTKVLLKGLNPDWNYTLQEINKGSYSRLDNYDGKTFSGKYLMETGLEFLLWGEYESNIIKLTATP